MADLPREIEGRDAHGRGWGCLTPLWTRNIVTNPINIGDFELFTRNIARNAAKQGRNKFQGFGWGRNGPVGDASISFWISSSEWRRSPFGFTMVAVTRIN
jgi:hypothetical protein